MLKILAVLAVLASACSPATMRRGLHYVALGTEVAAQGSLACDAGSTHRAIETGGTEQNPIMGTHPDGSVIGAYFVGVGAGVTAYNRVLPDILRIVGNTIIIGAEFAAAAGNSQANSAVGMCGL
jgi:hypothetical protein